MSTTEYFRKPSYIPLMLTERASKSFQIVHINIFKYEIKNI